MGGKAELSGHVGGLRAGRRGPHRTRGEFGDTSATSVNLSSGPPRQLLWQR
jgi:hypothetical protein